MMLPLMQIHKIQGVWKSQKSLIQRLHFSGQKSQKVLPDTSIIIRQKLVESTKIEMRHFG